MLGFACTWRVHFGLRRNRLEAPATIIACGWHDIKNASDIYSLSHESYMMEGCQYIQHIHACYNQLPNGED